MKVGDMVLLYFPDEYNFRGKVGLLIGGTDSQRYFKVLINNRVLDVHVDHMKEV